MTSPTSCTVMGRPSAPSPTTRQSARNEVQILHYIYSHLIIYLYRYQHFIEKVKKFSMARSLPVENILTQNVVSIINYLHAVMLLKQPNGATPSCSQPQPATDNGVRYGRSNGLVAPPPSWAIPRERLVHSINQCNVSRNRTCNRSMRGNHLAYAATQSM